MTILSSEKFTKRVWIDNVHKCQVRHPSCHIKDCIERGIEALQEVILSGEMLVIEGVGRIVVVIKPERYGVRNVRDPHEPDFSVPKRLKLCFYATKNYKAMSIATLMKPDCKKLKASGWINIIDKEIQDRALSTLIINELMHVANHLIDKNAQYKKIEIHGLLNLSQVTAKERMGRNPNTGESIIIKEKLKVRFKQSTYIKNELAKINVETMS